MAFLTLSVSVLLVFACATVVAAQRIRLNQTELERRRQLLLLPRTPSPSPRGIFTVGDRCFINVCYAIDSGGNVTNADFLNQLDFAGILAGTAGTALSIDIRFAAVQYGLAARTLTSLTSDVDAFLGGLETAELTTSPISVVNRGIWKCFREFRRSPAKLNQLVVFAHGENDFFRFRPAQFIRSAMRVFNIQTSVTAIGIGNLDSIDRRALRDIAGTPQGVIDITNPNAFLDILEKAVSEKCDNPLF